MLTIVNSDIIGEHLSLTKNLAVKILAETDGNEPDGMSLFLPEPSEIFWSLVIIVILAIAFYKFFLPTANKILEERSKKIDGEITEAAKIKAEAEALHQTYSNEIKKTRVEAAEIKDDARFQASEIIQDARKKAAEDAELIIRNAHRAVESERKAAETQLKKQVGSLAMAMTQKMLLNGTQNEERQSKMIDASIERFEHADLKQNRGREGRARSNRNRNRRKVQD